MADSVVSRFGCYTNSRDVTEQVLLAVTRLPEPPPGPMSPEL